MGLVTAVARDDAHRFGKQVMSSITLLAGLGVAGDAHAGTTVQHRSRVQVDPAQPNLRQIHLIDAEILAELALAAGEIGENVDVCGVRLLALPVGTRLTLGDAATVELTGLRNPCAQLDAFRPGLMRALLGRHPDGSLARRAGVMAVVIAGGEVRAGDAVTVSLPPLPHRRLERV